jgi:hypothetical protein
MQDFQNIIGDKTGAYGSGPIGLSLQKRLRHLYVIGKSGVGKTTMLRNIAIEDILAGRGVCVIDPHGDFAEELLSQIPRNRTRDTVYINLADSEFPVAWNPLSKVSNLPASTIAYGIVSAFKHVWSFSWGPRMEYVLTNCLHALVEAGESLVLLPSFLTDQRCRAGIIRKVKDVKVRHFFEVEFEGFDARQRAEIISPIQNKIGQLLTHESVRNIFASRHSKIDLRYMMDSGRILIVNLAKGRVGEEPANLFGSLLVSALATAALSRGDIAHEDRRPFLAILDEFQNFSTDSFSSALSEVRKYGLGLTLAHQFTGQLSEKVRAAVFGNVATKVLFSVGAEDAEKLALESLPYPKTHLLELSIGEALFVDGGGEAKIASMRRPIDTAHMKNQRTGAPQAKTGRSHIVRSESRRRFCNPKAFTQRIIEKVFALSSKSF